ncbi:protein of unknown function [Streptantibioticus cattleyicolor NRRL 8057 = DSM 46488]|nr:protein of unknown function [Streptantibioticus cattleyicolor NRRL 8057 = DSM 46488]
MLRCMPEALPTPARADGTASRALSPTDVVLGPQPVEHVPAEGPTVIVGEVMPGRHRAPHRRNVAGGAVLSATVLLAGLSLLLTNASSKPPADGHHSPAAALPDQATGSDIEQAPARTSMVTTDAPASTPASPAHPHVTHVTAATAPTHRPAATSPHPADHPALPPGLSDLTDWFNAIRKAAEDHHGHRQTYRPGDSWPGSDGPRWGHGRPYPGGADRW